tara:strand:+ start:891 stop:1067 length:177 start_codon:yes stop_codon:yes gene_type:complete
MIKSGIIAGLKPEEIRDMIPKDTWLVFQGWTEAHSPEASGSNAMTQSEYHKLLEKVNG